MNLLDWILLALLAMAAFKGFQRGFIIELASLVALVLGIWVAAHFSDRVSRLFGIDPANVALAFLVTFLVVLLTVHLLARFLTTLIDLAQLELPNKLAGVLFGVLRSVFTLSIALNLLVGYTEGAMPPKEWCAGSALYGPVRQLAPLVVPALGETKWVKDAVEVVKQEVEERLDAEESSR
ncbi:MAG: CvpA family protein [Flavobacteriales bacterium]|nr:CvpA family protein [Flavobacteriales bacterium]MBP7448529.1 CvpA family protein [Flavobacteriales bacterium]